MELPFDIDEDLDGPEQPLASSVLLVDDEPVVLDVLQKVLARDQDLFVTTATSAELAIPLLTERQIHLLVTDKNLPGMAGIELVAQACKLRPGIEAILITGYPTAESVLAALAAGASDYLTKPFDDLAVVRAKIRSALERREERIRGRKDSIAIAREALELLQRGKLVPDSVWDQLDERLAAYEASIRRGGSGAVRVIGSEKTAAALRAAELDAVAIGPEDPAMESADVVVIETGTAEWRSLADRLRHAAPDVLLLASPDADVADLLDAISLRLDLVGFGVGAQSALPSRVHALLMRRSVQRAHDSLAAALTEFREALKSA